MKTVRDVLSHKGSAVVSVPPDQSVYDTLALLAQMDIGAVLVLDGDEVAGIFSERDYARQVILKGKASRDTRVREVMTTRVIFVGPDYDLEECMALMTEKRIRHLPVLDDERLAGLISIGDVVKAVISEKQFLIQQLESYIATG